MVDLSQWFNALNTNEHNAGRTKPGVLLKNIAGGSLADRCRCHDLAKAVAVHPRQGSNLLLFQSALRSVPFHHTFWGQRIPRSPLKWREPLRQSFRQNQPSLESLLAAIGSARGQTTLQTIALGTVMA